MLRDKADRANKINKVNKIKVKLFAINNIKFF